MTNGWKRASDWGCRGSQMPFPLSLSHFFLNEISHFGWYTPRFWIKNFDGLFRFCWVAKTKRKMKTMVLAQLNGWRMNVEKKMMHSAARLMLRTEGKKKRTPKRPSMTSPMLKKLWGPFLSTPGLRGFFLQNPLKRKIDFLWYPTKKSWIFLDILHK